jgi:hypothetical protein
MDDNEVPSSDEQAEFYAWVESQIHLETAQTDDAECVCNAE